MHHVDQQVVIAAQAGDWNKVEALQPQVFEVFWDTPEGVNLQNTGISTRALSVRLIEEFQRRFAGERLYPGVLFVHRFQEIADDILRSEALQVTPEPEVEVFTEAEEHEAKVAQLRAMMEDPNVSPREVRTLRESSVAWRKAWNSVTAEDEAALRMKGAPVKTEPAETEQFKKLKQFAHIVNEHVAARGAGSIGPVAGFVKIHAGGKTYDYPNTEFRKQLEAATIAGLIQ
jgi:hypothetical protein